MLSLSSLKHKPKVTKRLLPPGGWRSKYNSIWVFNFLRAYNHCAFS